MILCFLLFLARKKKLDSSVNVNLFPFFLSSSLVLFIHFDWEGVNLISFPTVSLETWVKSLL